MLDPLLPIDCLVALLHSCLLFSTNPTIGVITLELIDIKKSDAKHLLSRFTEKVKQDVPV
jgi:hypothetical protein